MPHNNNIGWNFDETYTNLPSMFYSPAKPDPATNPTIVFFNDSLAKELGLDANVLQADDGVNTLTGNSLPNNSMPIAQAYAGHQFGNFTMLGDGRAIMLGEQLTPDEKRYDIQFKGSGRTAYSRGGDGFAAIGPMLREYIMSEAMHGLNIPTTRSLAVIKSDDPVYRDDVLSRGILTRVAKSHLRVGTFQYALAYGDVADVQALADYAINRHYPDFKNTSTQYADFLRKVVKQQAYLVAKWQLVGFIHGVMNTDNMTISGETIDYGPCAFMNSFAPNTVFSSIDHQGRYAYGNQPAIANWNVARFAETLLPLLDSDQDKAVEIAKEIISSFQMYFSNAWLAGMRSKLGLFTTKETDNDLISELVRAMEKYQADYNDTFLALTRDTLEGEVLFQSEEFNTWYQRWQTRLQEENKSSDEVVRLMRSSNPALIPRNHLVERALTDAVEHDNYDFMNYLLSALKNPFAHSQAQAEFEKIPVPQTPYQTYCGT